MAPLRKQIFHQLCLQTVCQREALVCCWKLSCLRESGGSREIKGMDRGRYGKRSGHYLTTIWSEGQSWGGNQEGSFPGINNSCFSPAMRGPSCRLDLAASLAFPEPLCMKLYYSRHCRSLDWMGFSDIIQSGFRFQLGTKTNETALVCMMDVLLPEMKSRQLSKL